MKSPLASFVVLRSFPDTRKMRPIFIKPTAMHIIQIRVHIPASEQGDLFAILDDGKHG